MAKLGFVCQHPTPLINPLLRAGPGVIVCIESPGLIDSLKPLAPDALYIFRKYRGPGEQKLDMPAIRAREHIELMMPAIEKSGYNYDGFQLYNEIPQNELDVAKKFRDFQLHCLDRLQALDVLGAVDCDPTWHPHFPEDWPPLWEIKRQVYDHPAARWRCRHEYLSQVHYPGGIAQWGRHGAEIDWLRAKGYKVLDHIIDEWGWDMGVPVGPWTMGVKVDSWIQGAKDYKAVRRPEVVGYGYFGAGLDQAWPPYNLTSNMAPNGIVQAIAEFMKTEDVEPEPDVSWARVPEAVRRWYALLSAESFRLWPYQTIPFKGVELHGDRIGAAIIQCESGGDPKAKSTQPALVYHGVPIFAWGLMQVIPRVEGHPWFSNRPTIEELLVPATNLKWGMGIFHGSWMAVSGDIWEALRRYSGFASAEYTLADFWWRYGVKFRNLYKDWFGIHIPEPELDQIVICKRKLEKTIQGLEGAESIIQTTLREVSAEG